MLRNRLAHTALLVALLLPRQARAEDIAVPITLQAQLLTKVAEYDRNLRARAGSNVHVLLLAKTGAPASLPTLTQMQKALGALPTIAGLPHDEAIVPFTTAAALADLVRTQKPSIVYLGPGLRDDVDSISATLNGANVLTVSAVPDYVERGIVLGFDLVSGRPKLLVHLTQARKQKVSLESDVLKLMRIYE